MTERNVFISSRMVPPLTRPPDRPLPFFCRQIGYAFQRSSPMRFDLNRTDIAVELGADVRV